MLCDLERKYLLLSCRQFQLIFKAIQKDDLSLYNFTTNYNVKSFLCHDIYKKNYIYILNFLIKRLFEVTCNFQFNFDVIFTDTLYRIDIII